MTLGAATQDAEAAKKRARAKAAQPDRYAAIVIEATTGTVISETNPDRRLYPASLTKMMTLYMTFEAIQNGRLRKNDRMKVSSRAAMQEPSKLGLAPGSTLRVEDAILGLVTKSANDASVVLAEAIGGSESRFGQLMTAKARALGMRNSQFVNASGLHNPNQYSTARDMAVLGQALIRDFPREYKYFSTNNFTYAGHAHRNHNRLMSTYTGMDGIKTGYVYASGFNLTASAVRNGQRLIGVVFGGKTTVSRNQQMAKLLDAGFESLREQRVIAQIEQRRNAIAADGTAAVTGTTTATTAAATALSASPTIRAAQQKVAAQAPRMQNNSTASRQDNSTASRQAGAMTKTAVQAAAKAANNPPPFDTMGLVTEQGDSGEGFDSVVTRPQPAANNNAPVPLAEAMQPKNPATQTASAVTGLGAWSVQVGAYSSHDASLSALKQVKQRLPASMTGQTQYLIAPLMTNRGMIYRARLSGLSRAQADDACRILQGNCLIMASP